MEMSNMRGFTELGTEDPSFNIQWQMDSLDELSLSSLAATFVDNLHYNYSQPVFGSKYSAESSCSVDGWPVKQVKTNGWRSEISEHILHTHEATYTRYANDLFGIVKPEEEDLQFKTTATLPTDNLISQVSSKNQRYVFGPAQVGKRTSTSPRLCQAQDHIMAERKRREKLSERFIVLSALVPGLKKMDKASVLDDAIKYLKQLREQVKTLQEQTRKKSTESVAFGKKRKLLTDDGKSSSDDHFSDIPVDEMLPEIEARYSDNDVLISIHCQNKSGVVEKVIAELESFQILVINSTCMTFGTSALDITIIAQMDESFTMTAKDLVTNLHAALTVNVTRSTNYVGPVYAI